MSLALEHYRALLENEKLPAALPAEEAALRLKRIIADTQELTLSQLDSSVARQLGSILFSHEAGLTSVFNTLKDREAAPQPDKEKRKTGTLIISLSCLICAASCILAWSDNAVASALMFLAAEIASIFGMRLFEKKQNVKTASDIDARALFALAERRMEAIDRDLDAFISIPQGASRDDGDDVLNLIVKAITLKREDPGSIPDELMTAIIALMIARGYTVVEYSEGTKDLFDVMPTKRQTRTITPAILKNDRLIARGMAIVSLAVSQTEEA